MKRSYLNRIGRQGKLNLRANRRIAEMWQEKKIFWCEIELEGCLQTWTLQNCHRHKRLWYKHNQKLLYDYKQVIKGCQNCHNKIENNKELTELTFQELRGKENEGNCN